MESLWQDLKYALRSLGRSPGFAVAAVVTLALGLGANAAIFTVAKRVVLDPMPFPGSERVMAVMESNLELGFPRFSVAPLNYVDFRDGNRSFEATTAVRGGSFSLTGGGAAPERLSALLFTSGYFDVYGIYPAHGRAFTPEDDRPGAPRAVILNHGFWQRRFGGDPEVLDRTLTLDGEGYQVVGIMPPEFQDNRDVFVPLALDFAATDRGSHYLAVRARLAEGVSAERAERDLAAIAARLAAEYPATNTGWTVRVEPLKELVVEDFRPKVLLLLAVAGLVLVIACANVANLFLTRLATREREVAVRTALGAGRLRLARLFLAESTLLALAGGALGMVLAWRGIRLLVALSAGDVPRADEIDLDAGVLLFAALLSLVTGLLFGLGPALQASRADLGDSLKEGGRSQAGGRRSGLVRRGLVTFEVALAVLPLVGALLLIESFSRLADVHPGFDADGALTARLDLPPARYGEPSEQAAFYRRLGERLGALPGVEGAGAVTPMPLTGAGFVLTFWVEGTPLPEPNKFPISNVRVVDEGYFEAMRIPLMRGRAFDRRDDLEAPQVVVINESTAARFFSDADPIGQRVTFDEPDDEDLTWMTIVGVVGDVHHESLAVATDPEIYWSYAQRPRASATLVLRTAGNPVSLAAPLRSALFEIDPELPVYSVRPLAEIVEESVAQPRFTSFLWGIFAALALLLAVIGVYGVISYTVTQRLREIGVRLALGAGRGQVARQVLADGMAPVAVGLAAGLLLALYASRVLRSMVYEVSPTDLGSFAAASLLLAAVGASACLLPTLRATRIDPTVVLREE